MILRLVIPALAASLLLAAAEPYRATLWTSGEAGVHTYRIPALVQTNRGILIAIADARRDSARDMPARISLVMRRSLDGGRTWEPSRVVREVKDGGVGDASLLLDRKTGRVWCFHSYGPPGTGFFTAVPGPHSASTTFQVHAMHSDDDGATWSEPVDLTPQVKDPAWYAMFATSGTHIQTMKGRYIVPMVVRGAGKAISARNAFSDDGGSTWKIGPEIAPGTDESHAVELTNGEVLQNMRNGKFRAVARSRDGGVRFGPVEHDPALIDPSCNAGIAVMRKGGREVVVFTNAASEKRENLTVKLSYDGGRTWPESRVLHAGPAAYSAAVALRDGDIAVLYEAGEKAYTEGIVFERFPPAWVSSR